MKEYNENQPQMKSSRTTIVAEVTPLVYSCGSTMCSVMVTTLPLGTFPNKLADTFPDPPTAAPLPC